jgi:Druantia protein DruA/Transposase Tn5 dimerisation domain/Transposase DNA-binding
VLKLCGRPFSRTTIDQIAVIVAGDPSITRSALARRVCELLDWRRVDGRLKEMSCRKALVQLDRRGLVKLPACQRPKGFSARPTATATATAAAPGGETLRCSLSELGSVEVIPIQIGDAETSALWNDLFDSYHYLGSGPLCGAQIRYLIRSEVHGWLGGLAFSAATLRLRARDAWIGWSDRARRAHLEQVVCNSRFLILPSVDVPNLASRALALSVARLGVDWQERYGVAPVLCETFVDERHFDGTCYRAANWLRVGDSAGRSDGFSNGRRSSGPKAIYVLPLVKSWRDTLCREPDRPLVLGPARHASTDWVEHEFGAVDLGDPRLEARLKIMVRDFFAQPGELVPLACEGSMAKTKAAYRFLDNDKVDLQTLLQGHVSATARRVSEHPVVLAVQDTTTLSYTRHLAMEGLGPINTQQDRALGLLVHDTLAFTPDGTPLGLVDVQVWARKPDKAGKSAQRQQLPIEEKESLKWLTSYRAAAEMQQLCTKTMVVSVGDREADIYELFLEAEQTPSGPKVLVRACHGRNRRIVDPEQSYLRDHVAAQGVSGKLELSIPRKGTRPQRSAELEVRFTPVQLQPPNGTQHPPVSLWVVQAVEAKPSSSTKDPLEWTLLTSVEVSSFEQAAECLRWYATRWGIEVYHKTLKSGCRIQDRRLEHADRLECCLAIDFVIAWRIYQLSRQCRETPDVPCSEWIRDNEWKVAHYKTSKEPLPTSPPTLRVVVRMIAKMGGFLGRKGDGEPGTITLWRGLARLEAMVEGYEMYEALHRTRDGP